MTSTPKSTASPARADEAPQFLDEETVRRNFAIYFDDLRKEQLEDGVHVDKFHEWGVYLEFQVEEGKIAPDALSWKCPKSLTPYLK